MSAVGFSDNNKRPRRYCGISTFIYRANTRPMCKQLKKYNCTIVQEDLVQLKHYLEIWARIQIDEENNNDLKRLGV